MRSPNKRNATRAVNITVMALVMAPIPAGARSAPQANSTYGAAELMAAMPEIRSHRAGVNRARSRHRNGSSTTAPSASRVSTSGREPKSAAANRMKRKEPPHTAPRSVSSSLIRHVNAPTPDAGATSARTAAAVVHSVAIHPS